MFYISTERYSDFNSMIERYEQEMRKLFEERQSGKNPETVNAEVFQKSVPIENIESENKTALIKNEEPKKQIAFDGIGSIIVEVTTARGAVPIEEANVVIDRLDIDDPQGRQELVAVRTTNRSGRTEAVSVKTVSRELSLVPGNAEPFSTFYVTAAVSGFEPVNRRPVDVFANEVSILKIDLIPKPEQLSGGAMQNG